MIKKLYDWLVKEYSNPIGFVPREHPSVEQERIRDRQRQIVQLERNRERIRATYSAPPVYVTEMNGMWVNTASITTAPRMRHWTEYEEYVCDLYGIDVNTHLVYDDYGNGSSLSDCRWETEKRELICFWSNYQSYLKEKRSIGIFENEDFTI